MSGTTLPNPMLNPKDLLYLLSDGGQAELVTFIAQARREHGTNWQKAVHQEFPEMSWAVGLITEPDGPTAYATLQKRVPQVPLFFFKAALLKLHAKLRATATH